MPSRLVPYSYQTALTLQQEEYRAAEDDSPPLTPVQTHAQTQTHSRYVMLYRHVYIFLSSQHESVEALPVNEGTNIASLRLSLFLPPPLSPPPLSPLLSPLSLSLSPSLSSFSLCLPPPLSPLTSVAGPNTAEEYERASQAERSRKTGDVRAYLL